MIARRNAWVGLIALALAVVPRVAAAKTVDHYVAERNGVTIEISAPRADIVRIRAGKGALPEDASWAVSQQVRGLRVPLDIATSGNEVTVRTSAMTVMLDRATLAVSIRDADGRTVLADAPGNALDFANGGFRLRKAMPPDAHYFGLGDKTGPLDRRGGAYTLRITDQFGFGVATDPLY